MQLHATADDLNDHILPDVLCTELRVVFCGTRAGSRSARRKAYYSGRGNKFWPILSEIGLTPRHLSPDEFRMLPEFGIGLTDLAKGSSGGDATISAREFDLPGFHEKMSACSPRVIAFNGKKAAAKVLRRQTKKIGYGLQNETIGASKLFVLPSTSSAGSRYWKKQYWLDLARLLTDFG